MQAAHEISFKKNEAGNKKRKISLPDYTVGEEILNTVTHAIGALLGIFVLIFCVLTSVKNNNAIGAFSSTVYGLSMILVYTISSIYHGLGKNNAKRVFRVLDHCAIYLLIAGTYTPITLSAMVPIDRVDGFAVFGLEWGLAALAITLTAIDMKKFSVFSMVCYIVMGWMAFLFLPSTVAAMTLEGFGFILGGGIVYTIGAVFYGLGKKKRYAHGIFHVFTVIGSFLQFFGVALYCL